MDQEEKLFQRIKANTYVDKNGCWHWLGAVMDNGYGTIGGGSNKRLVHRVMFAISWWPIPENYHVDHLCNVRDCVNPDHLEAVTRQENDRRRSERYRAKKTHCSNGHELTVDNIYIRKTGAVRCKTCLLTRMSRYYQEKKGR